MPLESARCIATSIFFQFGAALVPLGNFTTVGGRLTQRFPMLRAQIPPCR
jgi:hypothetical protein